MRFIDEASIRVSGGHGGPGCVSFRRETFIPRGGPDGGDGGDGGDVVFISSNPLGSLQDFRFRRVYQAPAGAHGSGANKAGRDGENILLPVPVGTVIKNTASGEILMDFTEEGQTWVACHGGRGGKGNAHFVSSTFQAPKFAQPGEEGENREITLELKLLADAGIIGYPNAGKSTLISRISAAKPKIADYPFTTLTPNLGVVTLSDLRTLVVADIPGLVEGAHQGAGLGHRFLKHMERTRLFIHLLDASLLLGSEDLDQRIENFIQHYQVIRQELGLFNEMLLHKPEIVVINKADLFEADPTILRQARTALRQRICSIRGTHPQSSEPYLISAVSGVGLHDLLEAIFLEVQTQPFRGKKERETTLLPNDEGLRN